MKRSNQAGFGVVEIILVVAVLALIGVVGYRLYSSNKDDSDSTATTQKSSETPIEDSKDLDKATEELNSEDIDGDLDTSEIDAALQ